MTAPRPRPRVAVLGIHLEANAFAPVTTGDDFRASCWFEGDSIVAEARKPAPAMPAEMPGFFREMDRLGEWEPVPILLTGCEPGGPVEASFLEDCFARIRQGLASAGKLDAVYISNHGAMISTSGTDPDGELYALVREVVGPDVPVVSTVDLHANISERMVESVDAIVSYRTNPHVDQRERAAEAAGLLHRLMGGERLEAHFIRLPIVAPTVRLLTVEGPYADLIREGQRLTGPDVPLVSVVGGFAFSDSPENGLAILAYGNARNGDAGRAAQVATMLANRAWSERERFRVALMPLDDAIARAVAAGRSDGEQPICLADVADNPGGGGRGNATDLLEGLVAAKATGVLLGLFVDSAVAHECHERGIGAMFETMLNRDNADEHGRQVPVQAEVIGLSDGIVVGRRGIARGRTLNLGRSAAIRVGGLTIVVVSRRVQAADPACFEAFGLDVSLFRVVVLKSRGHFRAGFDEYFPPNRIFEVDGGGLTSPMLSRFPFSGLPRPVYPLDAEAEWSGAAG